MLGLFLHIAIQEMLDGKVVDWMEKVTATKSQVKPEKEKTMAHIIVKLWPGKSEQQKTQLAEVIANDVMDVLKYGEEVVSVAIEEIKPEDGLRRSISPTF